MIKRIAIALLILLPAFTGAQTDPLVEAYKHYRAGELQQARTLVDGAVNSATHKDDPEAWLLRGFIHKDLFKDLTGDEAERVREVAIESLHRSLMLDTEKVYSANAEQAYEYMARSYYNDAAKALNEQQAQKAVQHFEGYKRAITRLDPKAQLGTREAEFYNALGTVYTRNFNKNRSMVVQFDLATSAYKRVLELDPGNYGANYNLATLYYNRGVYNIRSITAEDDIPSIQQVQEVSREFFQLALPYMLRAHDMRPDRRETLLGLEGIYYSLQDQESSDKFRKLFEELPSQDQER